MAKDRLAEIKEWWDFNNSLPAIPPEGLDDVVWLIGEVERLREEVKRLKKSTDDILRVIATASYKPLP